MGGVALLLWGLHMVQSGVTRAFGAELRRLLSVALRRRLVAFLAGVGITTVLQSSTATGLMTASFAARGLVALVPALAIMLGANVGTTLIVQFLSFNVSAVAPALFLIGLFAFRRGGRTRTRDLGRVAIGLGLMLLSLHTLLDTLAPAENAPAVRSLLSALTSDPLMCILLAAALTWAAHSSVAVILIVMSLAYSHFVTPEAALALTLGANLGSAVNPVLESGSSDDIATRRLPVGNLANRIIGIAVTTPFIQPIAVAFSNLEPNTARMTADFHMAFNVATAILFLPLLGPMAKLLVRLLPDREMTADPATPLYLNDTTMDLPSVALAAAARETLHIGDIVETMLKRAQTALMTNDRKLISEVSRMDDIIDKLHEAVKFHIVKITRDGLDDSDGRRAMEIVTFAINLEHVGDIIDKNLMELATKKIKHQQNFSRDDIADLNRLFQDVLDNMKLAFSVFISRDAKVARKLLNEKSRLREFEIEISETHLLKLRQWHQDILKTTSLQLDIIRDLKRIHSHICSVAYPVLEETGELRPNRLSSSGTDERTFERQSPSPINRH